MDKNKELQNLINKYMPSRYYGHEARKYAKVIAKEFAKQQLKILKIPVVSQQRELLREYNDFLNTQTVNFDPCDSHIDIFISRNGG